MILPKFKMQKNTKLMYTQYYYGTQGQTYLRAFIFSLEASSQLHLLLHYQISLLVFF